MHRFGLTATVFIVATSVANAQSPSLAIPQSDAVATIRSQDQHRPSITLQSNSLYMSSFESSSRLYIVNPTNGSATLVGTMGVQCTDLAFSNSSLYGISFTRFFAVNPTNGVITGARNHGFTDLNALVAAGSATPNLFYATGYLDNQGHGANFVRIDSATGIATQIGRLGSGLTSAGDLTFLSGVLYASVNKPGSTTTWLARIDTKTGLATLVGDTRFRNVYGLTARNGVLLGATSDGKLLQIDPAHGAGTLVGSNGISQGGLATSATVFGH